MTSLTKLNESERLAIAKELTKAAKEYGETDHLRVKWCSDLVLLIELSFKDSGSVVQILSNREVSDRISANGSIRAAARCILDLSVLDAIV